MNYICCSLLVGATLWAKGSAIAQSTFPAAAAPGPRIQVRLPERFRLLKEQLFDFRVEVSRLQGLDASLQITIDGRDVTTELPLPEVTTDNDIDPDDLDKAWTFRALRFPAGGVKTVVSTVHDGFSTVSVTNRIGVQQFELARDKKKNFILFLGDAMGTAYRDAGRLVSKSTGSGFREGFFDSLQAMDTMPVSGMVMTYALDRVVPDSANTATAWATGNKTIDGALNVFPDNNDFRINTSTNGNRLQLTKQFALDNPRVETLWEYLKRRYGYKTGIVTTADVTDATPAGEGAHSILRSLTFDIARQYVDGVFSPGPQFDVVLGGGMEHFTRRDLGNSGDARNLVNELTDAGYVYVTNRAQLTGLAPTSKLLGLFYSAGPSVPPTGASGNMNVAYDKLHLIRPSDEPVPSFNGFNDQPFLDEMTKKAIEVLSQDDSPFILMVEGASIDKQSHPNHGAGVVWDVIEFDKAVAAGRSFAQPKNEKHPPTLVLVTADHDQSMTIVGVTDVLVPNAVLNTRSSSVYPRTKAIYDPILGNGPSPSNAGNNAGEVAGFPDYHDNGLGYPDNNNRYRLALGFRTGNHTGSSVPITAEGPAALLFTGYFDQTDIFFKVANAISLNTSALDSWQKTRDRYDGISSSY